MGEKHGGYTKYLPLPPVSDPRLKRKGKDEKAKRKRNVRANFSFEIIIDGKYRQSVVRRKRKGEEDYFSRCEDGNVQTLVEKNESDELGQERHNED